MKSMTLSAVIGPTFSNVSIATGIGKPTLVQAFAQDSAIDIAKLLADDAIQALNHRDLNGGLEHLKLIVQELGISGNSTSNSKLVSHLRTHLGNSTILKKITEKAQQLVGSITKDGSEEKILKTPASNNFNSNLNV
jgi:hypothetical protein